MIQRRTKIVATLGPASSSPEVLEKMIIAGLDVARLNFSHGSPDEHRARAELVREIAARHGRFVALLGDLQGPKIRIAKFTDKRIELKEGDQFRFSVTHPRDAGTQEVVGIDYPDLVKDCGVGDELLLDDGRVVMRVDNATADELHCTVLIGGPLSDNKGINRRGGGLTAPALTAKDKADIKLAADLKLDYLAVSFPRDAADMDLARRLRDEAGSSAWLIAKIERAEAVADDEALDGLIRASDGVMVARGDLGVEIGDAELVGIQKKIILHARRHNKVVITATQMMESMITSPIPTRAEVSDVANAVLDGTDAVMLSAETAAGHYPVEAIQAMDRVCLEAEKEGETGFSNERLMKSFLRADEAIAMSAVFTSVHLNIKAIAALTESGSTCLWMSRLSTRVPIYALTPRVETRRKVTLFRGVYPINLKTSSKERDALLAEAEEELRRRGAVREGDLILLTVGEPIGQSGGTNTMKIVRVGDSKKP